MKCRNMLPVTNVVVHYDLPLIMQDLFSESRQRSACVILVLNEGGLSSFSCWHPVEGVAIRAVRADHASHRLQGIRKCYLAVFKRYIHELVRNHQRLSAEHMQVLRDMCFMSATHSCCLSVCSVFKGEDCLSANALLNSSVSHMRTRLRPPSAVLNL